jgi:putative flippase GtrA
MRTFGRAFLSTEFLRFLFVGGFAALVNFLSRIAFSVFLSFPIAIVLAYLVGMATAYVLSRKYVFGAGRRGYAGEIYYFVLVNVLAVLQTLAVSLILARLVLPWLGVRAYQEEIAHFVGVCVPVFSSYLGHKYWTFHR